MAQRVELTATVSENQLGQRLDQALAELFPDYSRSRIKEWILDQRVLVNGKIWDKPKEKVFGGEAVAINAEIEEEIRFEPQDIPLDIVYEDDDILVINKPRDFVECASFFGPTRRRRVIPDYNGPVRRVADDPTADRDMWEIHV